MYEIREGRIEFLTVQRRTYAESSSRSLEFARLSGSVGRLQMQHQG
jgi:hypothetical protein